MTGTAPGFRQSSAPAGLSALHLDQYACSGHSSVCEACQAAAYGLQGSGPASSVLLSDWQTGCNPS